MSGGFPNRAAIAAQQLEQLGPLLAILSRSNPFYQKKFAGLNPAVTSLQDFASRFPFTTKEELAADQKASPPYGLNLTFPPDHFTRYHQTSGTTSSPMLWLDTPESWNWMVANWKEVYRAAGVKAGDKVFFAFSFGPFIGFWLAFAAAEQLGCLCLPGGGMGSGARLRCISENRANVLCCTPSYAARLAEVAREEKIELPTSSIRKIIVAGEPGGSIPATRQRLEQLWPGAQIFDHHGMTETGPVSYECPRQPGLLHIIEPAILPEVIDGELVLTTLGRTGSPVVRYRTGDLVRRVYFDSEPCVCGRYSLGLDGGIIGRADEMVIVRGVNIYPTAVEEILRGFIEIVEYEVRVDHSGALAEVLVSIEPRPDCAEAGDLRKRVEARFQTVFNLRVPVELAAVGALPRYEMKARRWKFGFEPKRQST